MVTNGVRVDPVTQLLDEIVASLWTAWGLLNGVFDDIRGWLWAQMEIAGVPRPLQVYLVIAGGILMLFVVVRMTTGPLRLIVGLLFMLLTIRVLRPVLGF